MLTVITGCMWSGKSSRLLSLIDANIIAGRSVLVFKPSNDKRYMPSHIVTHSGKDMGAIVVDRDGPRVGVIYALENFEKLAPCDVMCFDEAQFFNTAGLISLVEYLLYEQGREIIVSGLSQDSDGKPFGAMPHLLAIADDIIHLKAVCARSKMIGAATRTYRKSKDTSQVLVGGAEAYEPRSFKEWLK